MKRLLIGMLSVLAVAGTATAVKAEQDTQVYGDPSDGRPGYTYDTPNVDDANNMEDMDMDAQQPNMDMQQPGAYDSLSRSNTLSESSYQATPFELGHLAYRGYLEDQGIESYSTFIQSVSNGDVDAEDIMTAGVEAGRLSPSVMEDEGYENSLRFMLQRLRMPGDS